MNVHLYSMNTTCRVACATYMNYVYYVYRSQFFSTSASSRFLGVAHTRPHAGYSGLRDCSVVSRERRSGYLWVLELDPLCSGH